MKRTIIAAALIAGAFMSAHADYAASDNIYGIINIPIVAGMNAVGVSLLPMDPAADRLHDVILPEGLTFSPAENADSLWTYDAVKGYAKYYLSSGNVWTNGSSAPTATLGMGAWIKAASAGTIYQVGIVTNATSFDVAAAASGASFIANPFPTDLDVNGGPVNWTNAVTGANSFYGGADQLLLWDGAKYNPYYYIVKDGVHYGWYDKSGEPPLIAPGAGVFLMRKTSNANAIPVDNPFVD